jgi:hypothetical protein
VTKAVLHFYDKCGCDVVAAAGYSFHSFSLHLSNDCGVGIPLNSSLDHMSNCLFVTASPWHGMALAHHGMAWHSKIGYLLQLYPIACLIESGHNSL